MTEPIARQVEIENSEVLRRLVGPQGTLLKVIAEALEIEVAQRGQQVLLMGEVAAVERGQRAVTELALLAKRASIGSADVRRVVDSVSDDPQFSAQSLVDEAVRLPGKKRSIVPKTPAQRRYLATIRRNDLTFGIGPAGTGKTYLAMAMAVSLLLEKKVRRIVLTRPAVEAGERLGFLPGDLAEKVNPYLRPLYDALHDMVDFQKAQSMVGHGQIEVAPLAFMRGRTLNHSFVVLDEAQNTTSEQMRMFLTRLGQDTRTVVTGDITQVDLPAGRVSGLAEARHLLGNIKGIGMCTFSEKDVVRHPLVQKIVMAYEKRDLQRAREAAGLAGEES